MNRFATIRRQARDNGQRRKRSKKKRNKVRKPWKNKKTVGQKSGQEKKSGFDSYMANAMMGGSANRRAEG